MALLLSLPPPPPPDSPPPAATSSTIDDPALQMFYAEINSNSDDVASPSTLSENVHEEKNREKKIVVCSRNLFSFYMKSTFFFSRKHRNLYQQA